MANEFFGKFAAVVGDAEPAPAPAATPEAAPEAAAAAPAAAPEAAPEAPAAPVASPPPAEPAPAKQSGGLSPAVWVGGLIVAAIVVLVLLT